MKFFSTAIATAALLASTDARAGFGKCPDDIKVITIDQSRFAGTWYEIQRDFAFPMEIGAECVTSVYRTNAEGGMDYWYRGYYWMMAFQYMGVGGKISDCDQGSADTWTCKNKMNVSKDKSINDSVSYPMHILGTDYDNWMVMYNCLAPMGDMMSMDHVWIYSRTQSLTGE